MALISAQTIITSVSLFHLTLAYFFLTSPGTIEAQALVYFLGESMGMPEARGFDRPSPALAFLGAMLALGGLSDLISLSMPEEIAMVFYWGTQAPLRSVFATGAVVYLLLSGGAASVLTAPSKRSLSSMDVSTSGLKNRVFFTFVFVEMISWFWVWITLREERDALLEKARIAEQSSKKSS